MTWDHFRTKLANAMRDLQRVAAERRALRVDLTEVRADLVREAEAREAADRVSRVLRVSRPRRRSAVRV